MGKPDGDAREVCGVGNAQLFHEPLAFMGSGELGSPDQRRYFADGFPGSDQAQQRPFGHREAIEREIVDRLIGL